MTVRQFRVYSLFQEGPEKRWRPLAATVTLQEATDYATANHFANYRIEVIGTREVKVLCEGGDVKWPRPGEAA
jgi:hypothetical protein